MTRAVNVCIVTLVGFILDVSSVDGDTTLFFFGSVINLVERLHFFASAEALVQRLGDSSRQRRLTVIDVTNRTDIYVRFGTLEFFFSHSFIIKLRF